MGDYLQEIAASTELMLSIARRHCPAELLSDLEYAANEVAALPALLRAHGALFAACWDAREFVADLASQIICPPNNAPRRLAEKLGKALGQSRQATKGLRHSLGAT